MKEHSKDALVFVIVFVGMIVGTIWVATAAEGGNLGGRILAGVLFGSVVGGFLGAFVGRGVAEVASTLMEDPYLFRRRHLLRDRLRAYRVPLMVGILVALAAGSIVWIASAEANPTERLLTALSVAIFSGGLASISVDAILQFGIAKWLFSAVIGTLLGVIGVGAGWSMLDLLGERDVSGHVGFIPFPVLAVIPVLFGLVALVLGLSGTIQRNR